MKLYIYQGLDDEKVPGDVTHVIVDSSVTVIREKAFSGCEYLVYIIMGDNVKIIEDQAFRDCFTLNFIQLSKTMECIGKGAFLNCHALEFLFLPSTVRSIEDVAFAYCQSLILLILPSDVDLGNIGNQITYCTGIYRAAKNVGVTYELGDDGVLVTEESNRRMNEWLIHRMDETPFLKLCCNSSITTRQINNYLIENGNDAALTNNPSHGMTPLHMLSMNPHAPADAIAALLESNVEVAFCLDDHGKIPLDYARNYNVGGLVATICGFCNHRYAA